MDPLAIRRAEFNDARAMLDIYAPYIKKTAISFETEVPSVEAFASRISPPESMHPWLVAEGDGGVVGYAYGCPHRARAAYRYSVETSVYVATQTRRHGVGRALYVELLDLLTTNGFCNAVAGTTLPNEASVSFHLSLGFTVVGTFHAVGYKFGRWHDVLWLEKRLRNEPMRTGGAD